MAYTSWALRLRELSDKYGKVALGVHFSVSAMSTTTLYLAIKNNVDVLSVLENVGLLNKKDDPRNKQQPQKGVEQVWSDEEFKDSTVDIAKTIQLPDDESTDKSSNPAKMIGSGGAFGLALLCNKALFPVRVPITVMLTPPIARFLARLKTR